MHSQQLLAASLLAFVHVTHGAAACARTSNIDAATEFALSVCFTMTSWFKDVHGSITETDEARMVVVWLSSVSVQKFQYSDCWRGTQWNKQFLPRKALSRPYCDSGRQPQCRYIVLIRCPRFVP